MRSRSELEVFRFAMFAVQAKGFVVVFATATRRKR